MTKHYRLWINAAGMPLYVECLDGELTPDTFQSIADSIQEALKAGRPNVLGPEWEIRVLAA